MKFERVWAMPNRWTFTIKPIKELLAEEFTGGRWADPFAGKTSPAEVTNDLDRDMPTTHHMDALEFLKALDSDSFDGVLYDPPYSISQAVECYKGNGKEKMTGTVSSMKYWADCKNEIARIIKPGGKAICFGWSTNGLGKGRGFQLRRILIVPHGGSKNDTLVTVEHRSLRSPGEES